LVSFEKISDMLCQLQLIMEVNGDFCVYSGSQFVSNTFLDNIELVMYV